jgi:hypothetical protein
MLPTLPLKKLVIEVRYKPELAFYGKMDAIGIDLADNYPDWVRTPLTLEVRNKKRHRRVFLSYQRSFYEADLIAPDATVELAHAGETMSAVFRKLSLDEFRRVGLRQWFAKDLGKAFACMVDEFANKFLPSQDEVKAILTDRVNDTAFVTDYETTDGWKYHLRFGPMTKDQWFQSVSHEQNLFEQPEEEKTATFDAFRASIPDAFLCVDVDCFREDVSPQQFNELTTAFRRRSHDLVKKLIEFCGR